MQTRNTVQRQIVLQAVRSLHDHPTADSVYAVVAAEHPSISKATVYRNLNQLALQGEILRVPVPTGADRFDFNTMLPLAVATSIDALAVGVTFAFLRVNIVPAVSFIGCITFLLSAIGLKAGNIIGAKNRSRAEFAGGLVLILMGIKILLEHLGVISF